MDTNEAKIYTAILISAFVLGVILVFFVITIVRHQRRNLQLHKEKILAEINTLESERKRVASDLHDEIGPLLSAVKLQISSLDPLSPEDTALLENAGKYIDDVLIKIREISNNLMPNVLYRKGFLLAIQEFTDKINDTGKLQIHYSHSVDTLMVGNEKEVHLYRVVQEIIHNSIKHASARNISINISQSDKQLKIEITDNGKGFDPEQLTAATGHGLKNISSRVDLLKGELFLDTRPGKGVEYIIEIPIT